MKTSRQTTGNLVLLVLFSVMVFSQMAAAGQYENLTPLLVNLSGWDAKAPEGMDMDMGSMKMVQAMREYASGNKSLNAMIIVGNSMMDQGQKHSENVDSSDYMLKTQNIDGFRVIRQHVKKDAEGAVMVSLSGADEKGAQFIMQYNGLNPDEALTLAKEFDWEKLKKVTLKVK